MTCTRIASTSLMSNVYRGVQFVWLTERRGIYFKCKGLAARCRMARVLQITNIPFHGGGKARSTHGRRTIEEDIFLSSENVER